MFDWLRPEHIPAAILIFAILALFVHIMFTIFFPPKDE